MVVKNGEMLMGGIRWGPLLGPNRAFDPTRFFIFCGNVIGSPYGTLSSVTINPETGKPFGPEMPGSSVKDDVRWVLRACLI